MYLPADAPILDIHVKAWYISMRGWIYEWSAEIGLKSKAAGLMWIYQWMDVENAIIVKGKMMYSV